MAEFANEVLPINIEEKMRQSYLDYAMRELGNDWGSTPLTRTLP